MALINCPGCAREVSDKAVACPGCRCPIHADAYAGSVSEFGVKRLLGAEGGNFWGEDRVRGEVHADRRIDITWGRLLKIWALGLLGTLGFHYFAVGRFITGALRFIYGALIWVLTIGVLFTSDDQSTKWGVIRVLFILLLFPPSVYDLIVFGLGRFRDVFGNFIKIGKAAAMPDVAVPAGICPECGGDVSKTPIMCPGCGYRLRSPAPMADEMVRMAGFTTSMSSAISAVNGQAVLTDKRFVFGAGKLLKKMAAGESANFTKPFAMGDVLHDIPLIGITAVTSGKQGFGTLLVIEANGETYKFSFMKKAVHAAWEAAINQAITTIGG